MREIRLRGVGLVATLWLQAAGAAHADMLPPSQALVAPALSPDLVAMRRTIDGLLRGPLANGVTSIYAIDAQTGRTLYDYNADRPANPASNVKLIATATALSSLGPDFRYVTSVLGRTPTEGVIDSDVFLYGSYDPTLTTERITALASEVAAKGVHEITGRILLGQADRDALSRAAVPLTITATVSGIAPVVAVPAEFSFVRVVVTAKTVRRKRARLAYASQWRVESGQPQLWITVDGNVPRGAVVQRDVGVDDRMLFTGTLLRAALAQRGVTVHGDVASADMATFVAHGVAAGWLPNQLAESESASLSDIVAVVNKRSVNWLADRLVNSAAALTRGGSANMENGLAAMYAWLHNFVGIEASELFVDTGSGLSYTTRITARQVVRLLQAALGATEAGSFRNSLAVGGRGQSDGTLAGRFRAAEYQVRAKTGTLAQATALSGLLEPNGGAPVYFSIITNDHTPKRRGQIRHAHESLVSALAAYQRSLAP